MNLYLKTENGLTYICSQKNGNEEALHNTNEKKDYSSLREVELVSGWLGVSKDEFVNFLKEKLEYTAVLLPQEDE